MTNIIISFYSPLLIISLRIISCIQYCVTGYFIIFYAIFNNCLDTIEILISYYLDYLTYLTYRLTLYPTNIIFTLGAIIMLYIVRLILKDIMPFYNNNLQVHINPIR